MTPTRDAGPSGRYASTAQVALALGVSVTTVKRWVDGKILPAHRTAGGHRKLLIADVVRMARDADLPQADLSKLGGSPDAADPATALARLSAAFDRRDGDGVRSALHAAHAGGLGIDQLADRVVGPALAKVGDDWHAGLVGIMHEHRVTHMTAAALFELRAKLPANPDPGRPVALGGACEHDYYVLPSLLAEMTLIDAGWRAVNLGPHTPASALIEAADELRPALVWLSAAHVADAERFARDYALLGEELRARGVPLVLGGRALTAELCAAVPHALFGREMGELAAFAQAIRPTPGRPRRGRPPEPKGESA